MMNKRKLRIINAGDQGVKAQRTVEINKLQGKEAEENMKPKKSYKYIDQGVENDRGTRKAYQKIIWDIWGRVQREGN